MNQYVAPVVLALALLLSGCSAEHRAALAYADEQAKAFNDTEARILTQAPCAIRIGAYLRLPEDQQAAIAKLCGK